MINDNNSTQSTHSSTSESQILQASLWMMIGSKKVWQCINVRQFGNFTAFACFLFFGAMLTVGSSYVVDYGDFNPQGLINYLLFPLSILFICMLSKQKRTDDSISNLSTDNRNLDNLGTNDLNIDKQASSNQALVDNSYHWVYIPAILWLIIDCLITSVGLTFDAIDKASNYSLFSDSVYYVMNWLFRGVFWWQTIAVFVLIDHTLQWKTLQSVVMVVILSIWIILFEQITSDEPIFKHEHTPTDHPSYISEEAFYKQPALLTDAINQLGKHQQGKTDWYFLGVAGYGSQNVFNNETNHINDWFDKQVGTSTQSISLINSDNTWTTSPIASKTSIKQSLQRISEQIDVKEDVLFMSITSHGNKGVISLKNKPLILNNLNAKWLKKTLDDTGIHWRVLVVSACHSGSFIDELMTPYTLIITASKAEKKSFGCSNEADYTYFGKAFFVDSLPSQSSFQQAFVEAEKLIYQRELEKDYEHSEPQIAMGKEMKKSLPKLEKALLAK